MMVIPTEDPVEDGGGSRSHLSAGKQRRGVVLPAAGPVSSEERRSDTAPGALCSLVARRAVEAWQDPGLSIARVSARCSTSRDDRIPTPSAAPPGAGPRAGTPGVLN